MASAVTEVIDLTASPTHSIIVIEDDSHDLSIPISTNDLISDKAASKKRRRKRAKARVTDKEQALNEVDTVNPNAADEDNLRITNPRGQKRKREEKESPFSQLKSVASVDPASPPLFAIDTVGQPVGNQLETTLTVNDQKTLHTQDGLLLPSHVSVVLDATNQVNGDELGTDDRLLSPLSDAPGIEFWDDVSALGVPRYFHDTITTLKPYKTCKKCGDNDHDFRDCPNIVCLTCGARNEHGSRSCPILRYCFNCQAKGHLAKDCPRIGPTEGRRTSSRDCDRCGSPKHHTTNCPTLWRIYTYLTDSERDVVLAERDAKRDLPFDEGGEGFIARDNWCYNCGQSGHLGDDCREKFNFDRPEEDSAFGFCNCLTGPFASGSSSQSHQSQYQRAPRSWELNPPTHGGIPIDAQEDIGKKGREKAKAKAREALGRLEDENEDDDVPDWFNRNRQKSNIDPKPSSQRGPGSSEPKRQPLVFRIAAEPKDFRFGDHRGDSRPALLSRIDMDSKAKEDRYHNKDRRRGWDRKRDEDGKRRHQTENPERSDKRSRPNERRWKGGYDR